MKRALLLATASLAVAALAVAAVQTITLKRSHKVGDVRNYKIEANLEFQGTPVEFSGKISEKVVKLEDNGNVTIETTNSEGKVLVAGQEMPMGDQAASTSVFNADGQIIEMKGDMVQADSYRMANLDFISFPKDPVKVGDKWTFESKANTKTGAVAFKAEYEVLGEEKVGTFDTVKIKVKVTETEGSQPAGSDSTVWINKADGTLVNTEAQWKDAPFPGAPAPISAKVKITRLP